MAVNKGEIGIYGVLRRDGGDNILARTDQVQDAKANKTQEQLNQEALNKAAIAAAHIANIENPHSVNKSQVGLGNVSNDAQVKRSEMGKPLGVATLDEQGKVPLAQLGNIDTQVMLVVDELPNTDIKANKIYLVKNTDSTEDQNVYTEYVYVNQKWEKLGEFKPEVDLSYLADKSTSVKCIYRLDGDSTKEFTKIEGNNFVEALTKQGNFSGIIIDLEVPNNEGIYTLASSNDDIKFFINFYYNHISDVKIGVGISNDKEYINEHYHPFNNSGKQYIKAFFIPEKLINNSNSDKIYYGLISNNTNIIEYDINNISLISINTTINDIKIVELATNQVDLNFSSLPIGTLIPDDSKNNIAIEYNDGHIERFNKTNNITLGSSRDNIGFGSPHFNEYYNKIITPASFSVNGTIHAKDIKVINSVNIDGSTTINKKLRVAGSIETDSTLKAGETTLNGTLHVENHDIKSKSIYPANTGSSSLKDPSIGKVPGNYVVTKSNLGKGAHNYDKLFVENIYWSDCTDINRYSTSLNNEGTIQILSARGINKKPVWVFDGEVNNYPNCDFLCIHADNYSDGDIADTIVFDYSYDHDSEAPYYGNIYFNVENCTISNGNNNPFVFGNGEHYDEYNKIPLNFINLSNTINLPNEIDLNFNEPGYIYLENTVDSTASITIKLKNESGLYLDSGLQGESNLVYATDGSWFDLTTKADVSAIPTKVSQLTNDSNFIATNSNPTLSGLTIANNAKIRYIQKTGGSEGTYLIAETPADRVANKVYAADGSLFDVGKLVKKVQCNVSGDPNNIEFGYTTVDDTYNFAVIPTVTTNHGGIMSPADKVKLDGMQALIDTKADKTDVNNRLDNLQNYCVKLEGNDGISFPFSDIVLLDNGIKQLNSNSTDEHYIYADLSQILDTDEMQHYIYDKTSAKLIKIVKTKFFDVIPSGDFFNTAEPLDLTHTFYLDNEKTGIVENLTQLNIEASNVFVNIPYIEVDDNLDDYVTPQYIYDATDNKWIEIVETYCVDSYMAFNTEELLDLTHELYYSRDTTIVNWTSVGARSISLGNSSSAEGYCSLAIGTDANSREDNSIAIGNSSESIRTYSLAIGESTLSKGYCSTALGAYSKAGGDYAIALGKNVSNTKSIFGVGFDGVNGIDMDRDNYGLYLKDFGGYDGTNLVVKNGGTETLNPNIKSVQQIINEKADASAIPTKVSQLTNDSGYLTEHQSLDNCVKIGDDNTPTQLFKGQGIATVNAQQLILGSPSGGVNIQPNSINVNSSSFTFRANSTEGLGFIANTVSKGVILTPQGGVNSIGFDAKDANVEIGGSLVGQNTAGAVYNVNGNFVNLNPLYNFKTKFENSIVLNSALNNITAATTAEEVVTKFNALLADLKNKGLMEADE